MFMFNILPKLSRSIWKLTFAKLLLYRPLIKVLKFNKLTFSKIPKLVFKMILIIKEFHLSLYSEIIHERL